MVAIPSCPLHAQTRHSSDGHDHDDDVDVDADDVDDDVEAHLIERRATRSSTRGKKKQKTKQ